VLAFEQFADGYFFGSVLILPPLPIMEVIVLGIVVLISPPVTLFATNPR
jgi:hypothetical protein